MAGENWWEGKVTLVSTNSQNGAIIEGPPVVNWWEGKVTPYVPMSKAYEEGDDPVVAAMSNPTILEILDNEGGFQDDPSDSGNWVNGRLLGTNFGITPAALARYRGVNPNDITIDDIKGLDKAEAYKIYEQNYIIDPGFDQLPDGRLKESIIDMGVNSGPTRAVKLLQRAAGVEEDGIIGPQTLAAFGTVTPSKYADTRIAFYEGLAANSPKNRKFLKGWTNRANKYRGDELYPVDIQVAENDGSNDG